MTYRIAPDNSWIQCLTCGHISHNRSDAVNLYCGHCRVFHAVLDAYPDLQAVCRDSRDLLKLLAEATDVDAKTFLELKVVK